MTKKDKNIDVVFRNGLKNYEESPAVDLWDNIAQSVDTPKKRAYPMALKVAASVAIVAAIGILSFRMGVNSTNRLADNSIQITEKTVAEDYDAPLLAVVEEDVVAAKQQPANKPVKQSAIHKSTEPVFHEYMSAPSGFFETNQISTVDDSPLVKETKQSLDEEKGYTFEELEQLAYEIEQANSSDEVKKRRWSISALASPTYYSGMSTSNSVVANTPSAEQPIMSYSGGISFAYEINNRLSVRSGVYYSSVGQRVNGIHSYAGFVDYHNAKGESSFVVATSEGSINADRNIYMQSKDDRISSAYNVDSFDPNKANLPLIGTSLRQIFGYLELPLSLKYKVVDKKVSLNLIGGFSSNVLIDNKVFVGNGMNKQKVGATSDMNNVILSSTLGIGVEYNVSNNVSLNVEPTFHYYMTPINQSVSGTNPYLFGLFSGLSYRF